jgi:hypothetical protein
MTKFESCEINRVQGRFREIDTGEVHTLVLIYRIAPPCVPGALALCREGKKEGLG